MFKTNIGMFTIGYRRDLDPGDYVMIPLRISKLLSNVAGA